MKRGFRVRRLAFRRFLGISDPFELRDLAGGVNVVYGPNASGKTTTAKALEALIWPRAAAPANASLDAAVEVDGDGWSIRLDAGLVEYQQDGVPSGPPPTAPAEDRDRYRLWLPDLLRADDAGFARSILIESSGGYDLEEAAKVLERRRPLHRQRKEQAELRRARERVREARAAQEELAEESGRLAAKEARLAGRAELEDAARRYATALEYAERRAEVESARDRVAAFPPVTSRLRGDEADRLTDLRRRIVDADARREEAERTRSEVARQARRVATPPAGADDILLHRLGADLDRLVELDREIAEQERLSAAASKRLQEEEDALRGVADPGRLAAFGLEGIAEFERAAEAWEQIRQERQILQAELAVIPEEDPPEDVDRLHHGISLLRRWLDASPAAAPAEDRLRHLAAAADAAAGGAGLALLILGHLLLGFVALAVAGAVFFLLRRVPIAEDERPTMEREYLLLSLLEAPDEWNRPAVEACRDRLADRIERARDLDRAMERRRQLERRLAALERREPPAEADVVAVAEAAGLDSGRDAIRLLWLVQAVSRWQRARIERIAVEGALVEGCREQRALLEQVNERLGPLGFECFTETRGAKAAIEKLRQDVAAHERFAEQVETARAVMEREAAEIERLESEIQAVLARAEVEAHDEDRLAEWCAAVEPYRAAAAALDATELQRRRTEDRLRQLPGFDEQLLDTGPEALERARADADRELATLNSLAEDVGSLRARMEQAKASHALEDALAEESRCRDALVELRTRELRAAVAAVLVDQVERETRNEHLPDVFHRANRLFSLVTRGAYELRIGKGAAPTFRAFDTRTERGQALEELSSGTRVQLLLAVRVAFVEAREAGVALPLLMDETLANSDDERAAAIMDAVIALAASGRQVFYFTAQPDEVAKWRRALARQPDVDWTEFDLGEIRRLEGRLQPEHFERALQLPGEPSIPAGISHDEFLERLPVPTVDFAAPVGALHLWYLIEDPQFLHHLLTKLRVDRWGELNTLVASGGGTLLDTAALQRVRCSATVAAGILSRLRIGRGRPVDRATLVASEAVSDRFIDEVAALCHQVGGDAGRLIDLLDARAVAKFYRRNVEALREYLEDEGFLDRRERLSPAAVRAQVVVENATMIDEGRFTFDELDRLLGRLSIGAFELDELEIVPPAAQPQLWPEPLA
jgi:DNA repair protein SbcC/Rad50